MRINNKNKLFSYSKCPQCGSKNIKKVDEDFFVCEDCGYEMDEEELYEENISFEPIRKKKRYEEEDY